MFCIGGGTFWAGGGCCRCLFDRGRWQSVREGLFRLFDHGVLRRFCGCRILHMDSRTSRFGLDPHETLAGKTVFHDVNPHNLCQGK